MLTTANTWKDGIRDFTLRIHTGSPDEIVATCFPATFRKRPGNVLEAHLKNYHPADDLRVYIGNMRDCPGERDTWGNPPDYRPESRTPKPGVERAGKAAATGSA